MPIYEYVCQKCGNILEVLQSYDQNQAGQDCPVCQSQELVKKISAANIGKSTSTKIKEGSCCGSSERSSSCPPGGCCGNNCS